MIHTLLGLTVVLLPALAAALPLEGSWNQACTAFDGGSATAELHIYNGTWMRITTNFADDKCTEPWLQTNEAFWADLTATGTFNITWRDISYKPLTAEITAAFRDVTFCDLTTWRRDEWTDVTGNTCGPLAVPAAGQMVYSIFKLSEPDAQGVQTLELGVGSPGFEGEAPSRRHVIFETSSYRRILTSMPPRVSRASSPLSPTSRPLSTASRLSPALSSSL